MSNASEDRANMTHERGSLAAMEAKYPDMFQDISSRFSWTSPIWPTAGPPAELNGHTCSFERFSAAELELFGNFAEEELEKLVRAWDNKTILADPIVFKATPTSQQVCDFCGQDEFAFDGKTFAAVNYCPFSNGYVVETEFAVPSGRLYVANDFIDEFPGIYVGGMWSPKAHCKEILQNAATGIIRFMPGTTDPGVWRKFAGQDTLLIGNGHYDDETCVEQPLGAEYITRIDTDNPVVSFVDGDEADKRGVEDYEAEIRVRPGVYTFRYFALQKDFSYDDRKADVIFAEFVFKHEINS